MGWQSVDTARCATCAVYTPTSDLRLAFDGKPYCVMCGIPAVDEWVVLERAPLPPAARLVAGLMLLVPLACFLAACASQL